MSYWVFTDIFEESAPRFTPFHGGFGLLNLQGINKPAFYSYKFMNQLGKTELQNADSCSWVCKDTKGNVQVLLWDFTNTSPKDSINNQAYYIKDLPAKSKGNIRINLSDVPKGKYQLEIYKVGYKSNDAYATYLAMGRPNQLSKLQVEQIKKQNDGSPVSTETINVKTNEPFVKELDLRENDVFFLKLIKQ
jgi:xylan 1,4-beta-xylosidase